MECWVLIAYQPNIGDFIFYYRSCNTYATTSSAGKEAAIEGDVCELGLKARSAMWYLKMTEMRPLKIVNLVPQLAVQLNSGSDSAV